MQGMTKTVRSNTARQIGRFWADESGATSIEYAILAVGIAVVIVALVTAIGSSLKSTFTSASSAF